MYPINYEADYERNPNRVTTFFRIILAIPWLIVGAIYAIAVFFTSIIAWFAVVILGRYPEGLFNFNSGMLRFFIRVGSYVSLLTDKYPPFGIGEDPTYPVRLQVQAAAERQSRLKAFFRLILAIPILIVAYAAQGIHNGAIVVSWLTIVFRGYQPAGVHNALVFTTALTGRTYGYVLLLTDDYPPVGAEAIQVGDVRPSAPAPPPEPPPAPASS
jgi:Domain of unknown function (DUF4389)